MKNGWKIVAVALALAAAFMLGRSSGSPAADYEDAYGDAAAVGCDHYYWGASCMECAERVDSFDGVSGEFYGVLRDWQADSMTVELAETDASYMAEGRSLSLTGIVHSFDLTHARYSLDYRWLDGGFYDGEFTSVDDLLGYTPKYPKDAQYGGKAVGKTLGNEIGVCVMMENGTVQDVIVMYP